MSSSHRLLVLSIVCLVALPGLAGGRRRAASSPGAAANPGGDCFTFGLIRAGLKASYLTTQASGNVSYTITYISDNGTQVHTTQHVTTPQATADADTILDTEIVGPLRAVRHFNVKTTTTVPILGASTVEADVNFVPSWISGPAQGWCTGATWDISPVTQTLVSTTAFGQTTSVVTTLASQGTVLSAADSITVPAGTFSCVKHRATVISGSTLSPAIAWTSREYGVTVRQDTLDQNGNVTSVTELQSIQ